jgi:hypothetical protein
LALLLTRGYHLDKLATRQLRKSKKMTAKRNGDNTSRGPWLTGNLRLTAFFDDSTVFKTEEWWKEVMGEEPEQKIVQNKLGLNRMEGSWGSARLVLNVLRSRIDWVLLPASMPSTEIAANSLGMLSEALPEFQKLAEKWAAKIPAVRRIALGSALLQAVADIPEGIKVLLSYLPDLKLDAGKVEDLSFQINRPRKIELSEDVKINRLSKWNVVLFSTVGMEIGPAGPRPLSGPSTEPRIAAQMEADINTAAEHNLQARGPDLVRVFAELSKNLTELAENGDRP